MPAAPTAPYSTTCSAMWKCAAGHTPGALGCPAGELSNQVGIGAAARVDLPGVALHPSLRRLGQLGCDLG